MNKEINNEVEVFAGTMQAAVTRAFGVPEQLHLQEVPMPMPRLDDVVIRVHAAGLNRAEIFWREGRYGSKPGYGDSDDIIGLELMGTVAWKGPQAKRFKVGDKVMALVGGGSYAQYARSNWKLCMPVPPNLSDEEAGAVPEAMITAHQMLMHLGQMKAGERVFIHGAGGGVGVTMVQMAKLSGASWIGVTASAGKHDQLKALGVDCVVDYQTQRYRDEIAAHAPGGKVDVIVCNMGGTNFEENLESLDMFGRLVQLGLQDSPSAKMDLGLLLRKCLTVRGSVMKSQTTEQKSQMVMRFADAWWDALASGELKVFVEKSYALRDADKAHRHLQYGQPFGKVVLNCR